MQSVTVPGDKSITHRALILAALGSGVSRVRNGLASDDTQATAAALRSLGAQIGSLTSSEWTIRGSGLRSMDGRKVEIDCGNSGTTARLLLGVLAGVRGSATLTGDRSLRSRPMRRVTTPLGLMGADLQELAEPNRLPVRVEGGRLESIDYSIPVASAQVKSALLLSGITGGAWVLLTEPVRTRDHTERLLDAAGVGMICHPGSPGWRVEMRQPPESLGPIRIEVPGDFSSAAFVVVAALLRGGNEPVQITGVGLNPTRTGLLAVLRRMGARIEVRDGPDRGAEPAGDLIIFPSQLAGTDVQPDEIPGMVDEIPALAMAAARADGRTIIRGAEELRNKESDRIRALVVNLERLRIQVEELQDGLQIDGTEAPLEGRVDSFDDHRIAMAFGVLAGSPRCSVQVVDPQTVSASYPEFWSMLSALNEARSAGGPSPGSQSGPPAGPARRHPVVTLDGPAGSGKSSTAREVARRLGLRHLDSGALYRAATLAAIQAGYTPGSWQHLSAHQARGLDVGLMEAPGGFVVSLAGEAVDDERLRDPEVTQHVSSLSSVPAVRRSLLAIQRSAAKEGLVADGRDMGTVVFPNADVKFFLTADLRCRARRRLLEKGQTDPDADQVSVEAAELERRDSGDRGRELSPLRQADDAVVLDTSNLSFEEQVQEVVERVRALTG